MEWMDINKIRQIGYLAKEKYFEDSFDTYEFRELKEAIEAFDLIFPYAETKIVDYKQSALNNNNLNRIMESMGKLLNAEANILFILSSIIFTDFYSQEEFDDYIKRNKKYMVSDLEFLPFIIDNIRGIEEISFLANLFYNNLKSNF